MRRVVQLQTHTAVQPTRIGHKGVGRGNLADRLERRLGLATLTDSLVIRYFFVSLCRDHGSRSPSPGSTYEMRKSRSTTQRSRAEQSRAEQSRAEQSRAEQSSPEKRTSG
ncbi:hypothetical protein DL771_001244 [Monosporascus sp. 5C6A]|nr:hypothetical protein DL771_001244 [Monosporascus sp. 5C6A]